MPPKGTKNKASSLARKLKALFPPANPACTFQDEDGQAYEEFRDMGKRAPNTQGTGRVKLSAQRSTLLVLNFTSRASSVPPAHLQALLSFLSAFLLLPVEYQAHPGAIDFSTNTFTLLGENYALTPPRLSRSSGGSKKRKQPSRPPRALDVFDLFDVLVHAATAPYASVLALFDAPLTEDGAEVMGRACGDRVCCVSTRQCDTLSSLLATACHELLHTLGVDHEQHDRCVMNAISSDEEDGEEDGEGGGGGQWRGDWLFLCRNNLRKLQLMHAEWGASPRYMMLLSGDGGGNGGFMTGYHLGLLSACASAGLKREVAWLGRVVEAFSSEDS